ncbi:MAG: methyl-accepting chemotaxis protein [bacterium]
MQRTAELVQEISQGTNEQRDGVGQVNSAIQSLDQIIQENAAAAEETASTSNQLASQATLLQEIMSFFNVGAQQSFTQFSKTTAIPAASRQVEPAQQLAHANTDGGTNSTPLLSNSEGFTSNDDQEFERY